MPSFACHTCGRIGPKPYCDQHKPSRRSPSSKATAQHAWRCRRKRILDRDDWTCQHCGVVLTVGTAEVDHLDPVSLYGPDTSDDRLVASCARCNNRRGNRAA